MGAALGDTVNTRRLALAIRLALRDTTGDVGDSVPPGSGGWPGGTWSLWSSSQKACSAIFCGGKVTTMKAGLAGLTIVSTGWPGLGVETWRLMKSNWSERRSSTLKSLLFGLGGGGCGSGSGWGP